MRGAEGIKSSTMAKAHVKLALLTDSLLRLQEANGGSWAMFLWNSRADAPTIDRILQTQRLALAREAAFRKLTVRLLHASASSIVDHIKVEIP